MPVTSERRDAGIRVSDIGDVSRNFLARQIGERFRRTT
jgi:hypothetical protein